MADRYFQHGDYRINHLIHIARRHQLVYLEVPKAGCSVVKAVLQHGETGAPRPAGISVHDREASPLGAPLRDGFGLDELFGPGSPWLTFTFVRNPFSRVLSCYLEKIAAPRAGQRDLRVHNLGLPPGQTLSFREFLERVAEQRPRRMDIHWTPQTRLIGWGRVPIGFVGRFETFQRDLRTLMTVAGLVAPEELLTERTGHTTNAGDRLAEHYADDRCVALVRDIYARDFDLLGYGHDVAFV